MNNTDPTSFESILAGVAKLRKEKSGTDNAGSGSLSIEAPSSQQPKLQQQEPQKSRSISPKRVINAFNQQKPNEWADSKATDDYNRKRPFKSIQPGKTVLVNTTQKENPLLNHLKSTNWRYVSSTGISTIFYDYLVRGRSVLFLTLTYHKFANKAPHELVEELTRQINNIYDRNLNRDDKVIAYNGVEVRYPFLDEHVIKFSTVEIPINFKVNKLILRKVALQYLKLDGISACLLYTSRCV